MTARYAKIAKLQNQSATYGTAFGENALKARFAEKTFCFLAHVAAIFMLAAVYFLRISIFNAFCAIGLNMS